MIEYGTIFEKHFDGNYFIFIRQNGEYAEGFCYSPKTKNISFRLARLDYEGLEKNRKLFSVIGKVDIVAVVSEAIQKGIGNTEKPLTVGERIRALRVKNHMAQIELAEAIGTTKQNIYKYENGIVANIPFDKIEYIASVFHVSPAFIMGWDMQNGNQ